MDSKETRPAHPPLQQQHRQPYRSDWVWSSHPPMSNQTLTEEARIQQQQQQQVQM